MKVYEGISSGWLCLKNNLPRSLKFPFYLGRGDVYAESRDESSFAMVAILNSFSDIPYTVGSHVV
jgi:hypothetical protein